MKSPSTPPKSPATAQPSLVERQSTGGETAEGGFDFQTHAILQRLPAWMAREGFAAFTRESMGDTEAKFFVPSRGERIEFLEAKNYKLSEKAFWNELKRFYDIEVASPGTFASFTLVCNGLPKEVKTVWQMLERIRKPASFYGEDSGIFKNSWQEFEERVPDEGWGGAGARFVFDSVFVQADAGGLRTQGPALFAESLTTNLPRFADITSRRITELYHALSAMIGGRINIPILRAEVEALLREKLPEAPEPQAVHLKAATVSPPDVWAKALEITFDWQESFAKSTTPEQSAALWAQEVTTPLKRTAAWIKANRRQRRINFAGSPRLSHAFAVGATFSAVGGYELDFAYRENLWSTDCHPDATTPAFQHKAEEGGSPTGAEVVVSIGILREIAGEVQAFADAAGLGLLPSLHIHSAEAILNPYHASLAVRSIKTSLADLVHRTGATRIHLFLAGPAPLALFLGHRANAICQRWQCYERMGVNLYAPSASL